MRGCPAGVVHSLGFGLDQPGKLLGHGPIVFDQEIDAHAAVDQRHHHLPDAVIPLVGADVGQRPVGIGVGQLGVVGEGFRLLEIGIGEGRRVVGQRPGQGVDLVQVEATTGTGQGHHLVGPPLDAREPVQSPKAHVDDVEGPGASTSAASNTSAQTKADRSSSPARTASSPAALTASAEKSSPVTLAPASAQARVSNPK